MEKPCRRDEEPPAALTGRQGALIRRENMKSWCYFCGNRAYREFWRPDRADWIWICEECLRLDRKGVKLKRKEVIRMGRGSSAYDHGHEDGKSGSGSNPYGGGGVGTSEQFNDYEDGHEDAVEDAANDEAND